MAICLAHTFNTPRSYFRDTFSQGWRRERDPRIRTAKMEAKPPHYVGLAPPNKTREVTAEGRFELIVRHVARRTAPKLPFWFVSVRSTPRAEDYLGIERAE